MVKIDSRDLNQLLKIYGSQRKLAAVLGVNQSQISRWLNKRTSPRVQTYKQFVEIVEEKVIKFSHKRVAGKHTDGRNFVRYEFPLWRRILNDPTKIPELFRKLRQLYKSVQNKDTQIKAQRLGISISTTNRQNQETEFYSKKAKRKYTRKLEELQFITTIIYARNEPSTVLMFEELEEKIRSYLMGTLQSEDIHDTETTKEAKTFYVFFEGESLEVEL